MGVCRIKNRRYLQKLDKLEGREERGELERTVITIERGAKEAELLKPGVGRFSRGRKTVSSPEAGGVYTPG